MTDDTAAADGPDDDTAAGWDALDAALLAHYGPLTRPVGDIAPRVPYALGGEEPLDAIRVYRLEAPAPHWHLVGFGLSELYGKEGGDPELSGFGIEFSLRAAVDPADPSPPMWAAVMLQQLAKYVVAQRPFAPGHTIHVAPGTFGPGATALAALAFLHDPALGTARTPNGSVRFLQVAALTETEYRAAKGGNAPQVLDRIAGTHGPLHLVDRTRAAVL